jgi:hypothetical protein
MPNSVRTPRRGVTESSRLIAEAVDDEGWQRFRVSMKGKSTTQKLEMLKEYYEEKVREQDVHSVDAFHQEHKWSDGCWVCIRLDNYIKALARGGQLYPGVSLKQLLKQQWVVLIKKD